MKKANFLQDQKKGFTLMELLIVIAIIGILAGVILVASNSARNKALVSSATQTAKSVAPYAADCFGNGDSVENPVNGGEVCDVPNGTIYPTAPDGCFWSNGSVSGQTYAITCGATTVECDAETLVCQ